MSTAQMLQLSALPSFALATISRFLTGDEILNLRIGNNDIKVMMDDALPLIFSELLSKDFDYDSVAEEGWVSLCVIPKSTKCSSVFGLSASDALKKCDSAFECWKTWKRAHRRYAGTRDYEMKAPYFLRAARIWARLERWLSSEQDHISSAFCSSLQRSLRPGLTLEDLHAKRWPDKTPRGLLATQALWSFYGDQQTRNNHWIGLFGGMSAYNYVTCTWFSGGTLLNDNSAVIAMCPLSYSTNANKFITVDPLTGKLKFWLTEYQACKSTGYDAVFEWMDEYVRRLETGYYRIGRLENDRPHPAILHYPHSPAMKSRCVTRGVECCAMAVFCPWSRQLGFCFIYSIQVRLLTKGEEGYDPDRGFATCQLKSRHWRIQLRHDDDNSIQSVNGDGVIGLYPLLREGSHRVDSQMHASVESDVGTFSYQSCTNEGVSFGGHLLFVPGSIEEPTGSPFSVDLASFPLDDNPDFLY